MCVTVQCLALTDTGAVVLLVFLQQSSEKKLLTTVVVLENCAAEKTLATWPDLARHRYTFVTAYDKGMMDKSSQSLICCVYFFRKRVLLHKSTCQCVQSAKIKNILLNSLWLAVFVILALPLIFNHETTSVICLGDGLSLWLAALLESSRKMAVTSIQEKTEVSKAVERNSYHSLFLFGGDFKMSLTCVICIC